jgi:nucleoside phosphorylase
VGCRPSLRLRRVTTAVLAVSVWACGGTVPVDNTPTRIAVLSTFPAEMAPVLEQATVEDEIVVNGRMFRIGMLAGVPVVVGLTGIGLVNAAVTTRALLDQVAVAGIIVSAVAGSTLQIGDVTVPEKWEFKDGTAYTVDRDWFTLAEALAEPSVAALQRCTVPVSPTAQGLVCMVEQPAIVVGGVGQSTDPFVGKPFPCQPDGGDLYGCDLSPVDATSGEGGQRRALQTLVTIDSDAPIVNDMETAAIAREAAMRGLPFIAFRAVSDGTGDPLRLPGFLAQFAAYYRFAAHNAAAATSAFLERLGTGAPGRARPAAVDAAREMPWGERDGDR